MMKTKEEMMKEAIKMGLNAGAAGCIAVLTAEDLEALLGDSSKLVKPVKTEKTVEEAKTEVTDKEEKPKKTTRSKRPNRNTQKKPRTTKKSAKKDEE